ncbi:hypothetical protein [Thermomonospora catenispora]|uniref:hypothetical protein n=1 Tax=Thermomonospora catenispora TaxID=2493090 RepID=UPI001120C909|nr:hypothetical protein [Thermomonospora catenispora]TNY38299.1 hypothetical protein EIO00_04645 [Thermomonospora catenispora]
MRSAILLAGISLTALAVTAAPAHAATGLVDGAVTAAGVTCSWTNATTSDVPPNTLVVDHTTVHPSCSSGGISVTLSASPTVSFDDAAGTAFSPQIDVSVSAPIVGTCSYRVTNATVNRQGTGRTYTGGGLTATETSNRLLCPDTQTIDSVTFTFH